MKQEDTMNDKKRIAVISTHEQTLNDIDAALRTWKALQPRYEALLTYYESPAWLKDYDASNRGAFSEIPCGVLSQDAVYDALMRQRQVALEARDTAEAYLTTEDADEGKG